MGSAYKTVISLDLALYKPAKQLQIHRNDLNKIILWTGELHFVMIQLQTIGTFIEGSAIDNAWIDVDLCVSITLKPIIEDWHVKQGLEAHIIALQALFTMYTQAFMDNIPEMKASLFDVSLQLDHISSEKYNIWYNIW